MPKLHDEHARVLIIDDTPSVRLLLSRTLPLHGYEVAAEADSGEGGVELAREEQPDVVILDLHMPGMSGIEALPQIRKESPGSKIVIYTNDQDERLQNRAYLEGAHAYVGKLAPISEVAETIERVLRLD